MYLKLSLFFKLKYLSINIEIYTTLCVREVREVRGKENNKLTNESPLLRHSLPSQRHGANQIPQRQGQSLSHLFFTLPTEKKHSV